MTRLLEDAVDQIIDRRFELLNKTGLSSLTSFVDKYKAEAFQDLTALSKRTGRRIFIFDQGRDAVFCSDCDLKQDLQGWAEMALRLDSKAFGTFRASEADRAIYAVLPYVTRRLLLLPIVKLQRAATAISRHEVVSSIDIHSDDELGQLARDMEQMSRCPRMGAVVDQDETR